MDSSSFTTSAASTSIRTTPPYEKSAEFARLYYFFEKLTQPRLRERIQQDQVSMLSRETTVDGPVPEDIAPLLKNLSAILTKDEPEDGDALGTGGAQVSIPETPTTALASTFATTSSPPVLPNSAEHSSTRPRRYTVAGSSSVQTPTPTQTQTQAGPSVLTPVGHQTRFPLGVKRYPFTFKLLLHKLYDLEDWAVKVQEVLATSQEQFRSLNSTPSSSGSGTGADNSGSGMTSDGDGPCSPGSPSRGGVTFTSPLFDTPPSSPLESPPARSRRRAQSTVSKTKANDNASRSGPSMMVTTRPSPPPPAPSRPVKRRIVNRRRSTNGLGIGKLGEWTYDAAVSSVGGESVDTLGHGSLRRRKRVLSSVAFVEEERRCIIRDVTNASF